MGEPFHQTPFNASPGRDAWDYARTYGRPGLGRTIAFRDRPLDYAPFDDAYPPRTLASQVFGFTSVLLVGAIFWCAVFCWVLA